MSIRITTAALVVVLAAASCGGGDDSGTAPEPADRTPSDGQPEDGAPTSPGDGTGTTSQVGRARLPTTPLPTPDPGDFVNGVDNPYLPLRPGTRWVYLSHSRDEASRIVTTVTDRTRVVQGISCVVVHDVESTLDGQVLEDTYDWYAQDMGGNVWYFGEDTTAYEDGKTSKKGSWEAGVDGAQAGVIMLAEPRVGDKYQQEYYAGEAEDRGEVLGLQVRRRAVPARYGGLLMTADTTPLEPRLVEHKFYARGVGVVYEETVRGGREQVRLVSMRHYG